MNKDCRYWMQEITALLKLALPVFIAQIFITSMSFVDAIMTGQFSKMHLAAIAVGGSFTLPAFLFTQAILFAVTPIVAQAYGAGDEDAASETLVQGVWLGIVVGLVVGVIAAFSVQVLPLMNIDPSLIPITEHYVYWMAATLPIVGVYQALRSFIEGHGLTRIIMASGFIGFLLHIPFNYVFVTGWMGAPEMGASGCGLSTLLAFVCMLITLLVYVKKSTIPFNVNSGVWYLLPQSQWQLLCLGFPMGLSMLAEVSIFSVIALLVAPLGADIVAGHQVALNISAQTFMLPYSLGIALTIRIGFFVGKNDLQALKDTVKVGYALALFSAVLTGAFMVFGTTQIASMYTDDHYVQWVAASLLFFAAIYQIPDALQVSSMGILRGFKITRRPMIFTLFAYWLVALPVGYILAFYDVWSEPWGARGLWFGLVIGLSVSACLLLSMVVYVFRHPQKHLADCNLLFKENV